MVEGKGESSCLYLVRGVLRWIGKMWGRTWWGREVIDHRGRDQIHDTAKSYMEKVVYSLFFLKTESMIVYNLTEYDLQQH